MEVCTTCGAACQPIIVKNMRGEIIRRHSICDDCGQKLQDKYVSHEPLTETDIASAKRLIAAHPEWA